MRTLLEFNSPDIFALCEALCNFSVRVYLPLIWKDSVTLMHGLAVYIMDGHPFAWDLPLESSAFYVIKEYYISFQCALFYLVLFSLLITVFYLCTVFLCYFISKID